MNRSASTARDANVNSEGHFHKLSFTKFGLSPAVVVDSRGNIRFANADYKNILLLADFAVAQLSTPSGGNDRMDLGFAIVQLAANGSRTLRKIVKGQYMRNNTNDPPFRTANVLLQRSLTLPDGFAGETWEIYLFAESQAAGKRLRINAEWNHVTNSADDVVGGGAVVFGYDDAVATAASEGGGGGGLDQAAVDARIAAQTKVYARSGQRAISIADVDPAFVARILPATGGADGKILGYAGGVAAWVDAPPSSDQTARDAAAAAQTSATEALTRAGTANDAAVTAKATADAAATKNTQQDAAIAEAQSTATGAVNKNTQQDTAIAAAGHEGAGRGRQEHRTRHRHRRGEGQRRMARSQRRMRRQRRTPSRTRRLPPSDNCPTGGSDGQFLGRAGGSAAWVAAPSGGGSATQVSGTSGWGENLLSSDLVTAHNGIAGNLAAATRTINLSGDVDSIFSRRLAKLRTARSLPSCIEGRWKLSRR